MNEMGLHGEFNLNIVNKKKRKNRNEKISSESKVFNYSYFHGMFY